MSGDGYPQVPSRSVVNRRKQRGVYDYGTIHSIVDSTPVLHVAFNPITSDSEEQDSFPAILPMLGCTGSLENPSLDLAEGPRHLYLHGYISSRLMKLPTSTDTDGSSGNPGVPVCVAATMMDGIVLAMTPFNHSCDYRSAVVHGFANAVTDEAEKFYAMELITNNLVSDRWSNTRIPPTKTEMQSTGIMRIEITSASAKIHTGPPNDERKDLKNQDMKRTVWTGVIPTWTQYGAPVEGPNNETEVPRYLQSWLESGNRDRKEQAFGAINKIEGKSA